VLVSESVFSAKRTHLHESYGHPGERHAGKGREVAIELLDDQRARHPGSGW